MTEIVNAANRYDLALNNTHLKASHVAGIAGILQTVLVAFEEEFQEESAVGVEILVSHRVFCCYWSWSLRVPYTYARILCACGCNEQPN